MRARSGQWISLMLLTCLGVMLQGCPGTLYQSIKADLDFELKPQVRERLRTNSEVIAIHYAPETSLAAQGDASRYDPLPLEDPLLTVKDRFLAAMHEQLGLTNLRAMKAPRFPPSQMQYGVSVRELVRVYGRGLVLDFQTRVWALSLYGDENWWELTKHSHFSPTVLAYMARARLFDLDGKQLLWQANCSANTERHKAEEWIANQNQLVKGQTRRRGGPLRTTTHREIFGGATQCEGLTRSRLKERTSRDVCGGLHRCISRPQLWQNRSGR